METDTHTADAEIDPLSRESIMQRIEAALSEGRDMADLEASQILGIPAGRIQAAVSLRPELPPRLSRTFVRHRTSNMGKRIAVGTTLSVVGLGGRELIKTHLTPTIQSLGLVAVIEMVRTPGHPELTNGIPAGFTSIHFADQYSNTNVRFGDTSFQLCRPEVYDHISNNEDWEIFNAPWDDRYPAFAVRKNGERYGVGTNIVIFLNLFGTATGQFIRSENVIDAPTEAFAQIMAAAEPHLSNVFRQVTNDPETESIREAVTLIDSVKVFGQQALGALENELTQAKNDLDLVERRATHYQEKLMEKLVLRNELAEKIAVISEGRTDRLGAAVTSAIRHMDNIRGLRSVRDVELTTYQGQSALYIRLYPCSVKTGRDALGTRGRRILCENLHFWLLLGGNSGYRFVWDNSNRPEGQPSLHPNIYSSGDTCWGDLSPIITQQIADKNWLSVVNLVTRLLQRVGYPEASAVSRFPQTELPAGFQNPDR